VRARWGLFARLAAVVAILLLLMQLLLVWLYVSNRGPGAEPGFRFPLPERVVAMVALVEASDDPGAVLAALNGPDLLVTISDAPVGDAAIPETRLPRVERALARYAMALGPRPHAAYIAVPEGQVNAGLRRRDRSLFSDYPLRMAIGLADGRTLIVETRDDLVTQVYSVPVGLWSGFLGVAAALVVLLVLRRETAPLRALARAAERFTDGQVQHVEERGAPEIRELIGAFNRMQLRIGDLLEARRVMLGALGHDLRTYLTRFALRADAAGVESLGPDIDRMAAVLDSCLALARDPGGGMAAGVVDAGALVRAVAGECGAAGQDVRVAAPDWPLPMRADPTAVERILRNLVENALRHAGAARLSARAAGAQVELEVADEGPGIDPRDLDRLQRPFERGERARTVDGAGAGLGLAIARDLAARNGGEIAFSANHPTGLVVRVRFPAAPAR
jgi:two-component system, OmpR family, osmolarity sensor histidine kinase EnvZ